jgi:hypothetical protein
MPGLVTSNTADYEALLRLRPRERDELAANKETHPLFDMAACTRDLEESLRRVCGRLRVNSTGTPEQIC